MKTLVLRHKANVGVTPIGILIVHDTNDPVLKGDTPMSQTLADAYCNGLKVKLYDKEARKTREYSSRPKDLNSFMDIGKRYFAFGAMDLEMLPFNGTRNEIEIDRVTYALKEL